MGDANSGIPLLKQPLLAREPVAGLLRIVRNSNLTKAYALYRVATMANGPQLTTQTLKVLGALLNNKPDALSGADIGRATRLQSGTLYPILLRLEQAGWVESYWESETPQELGRPRRRFYQLTAVGARTTKAGIRDFASMIGDLAWRRR